MHRNAPFLKGVNVCSSSERVGWAVRSFVGRTSGLWKQWGTHSHINRVRNRGLKGGTKGGTKEGNVHRTASSASTAAGTRGREPFLRRRCTLRLRRRSGSTLAKCPCNRLFRCASFLVVLPGRWWLGLPRTFGGREWLSSLPSAFQGLRLLHVHRVTDIGLGLFPDHHIGSCHLFGWGSGGSGPPALGSLSRGWGLLLLARGFLSGW